MARFSAWLSGVDADGPRKSLCSRRSMSAPPARSLRAPIAADTLYVNGSDRRLRTDRRATPAVAHRIPGREVRAAQLRQPRLSQRIPTGTHSGIAAALAAEVRSPQPAADHRVAIPAAAVGGKCPYALGPSPLRSAEWTERSRHAVETLETSEPPELHRGDAFVHHSIPCACFTHQRSAVRSRPRTRCLI